MGRRLRSDYEGAFHHVMNRGTAQTMLFRQVRDRWRFLHLMGNLEERFGVEIHAYALMGNHYHLLVRSRQARLAKAMQYLDGQYARQFNSSHGRTGALFQGRYHGQLIESDPYLTQAGVYIHLNAVLAGLVVRAVDYRWSSLPMYVGARGTPRWLHLDRLLGGRSSAGYLELVETQEPAVQATGLSADDTGVSWWMPEEDVDHFDGVFAEADRLVAARFGSSVDELYIVGRKSNTARMVVIAYTSATLGIGQRLVAMRYGLKNRHAVRSTLRRLRQLAGVDDSVSEALAALGLDLDT